jgi:uncharacterized protein YutE (UPF0331/DUF86 family)
MQEGGDCREFNDGVIGFSGPDHRGQLIQDGLNVLKFRKQVKLKTGATWHKELLQVAAETGIISTGLHETLSDYLSFRHFFVHAYSFTLRWEEIKPLVEMIVVTLETFKASVIAHTENSN